MYRFLTYVNGHILFFLVVVTYVIVHSSRRPCFNFRTYFFHSLPMDPNACLHSPVPVFHFELSAVQWKLCSALFSSYVFLPHFCNGEKKM